MGYICNDPYVYNNSDVLINNLDITDAKKLAIAEAKIYGIKLSETLPKGQFDYQHLQALHQHLFGDIYSWAGQTREVDISKKTNSGEIVTFARCDRIEPELNKILSGMEYSCIFAKDKSELCQNLSTCFNEINAAHPFREGNGRTNRLFCSMLADKQHCVIDWKSMDRDEYIQASIEGTLNADYKPMSELLHAYTKENELEKSLDQEKTIGEKTL